MSVRKIYVYFALLLITIAARSNAQQPLEVWISPDYNETTEGWDITRFAVIQDGINAVAEAGSVYVGSGVYHESLIIQKPLHLIGEGPDVTEIDADTSSHAASINHISGGSISDISFINSVWAGIHLILCDSVYINNDIFKDNGQYGIHIEECENIIIENSAAYENSTYGMYLQNSDSLIVQNNICGDNEYHGMDIRECENILIDNNTVYGSLKCEISLFESQNNIVKNNNVHSDNAALSIGASCGNLIENNEFYSKEHGNIYLGASSNNNRFINNKITGGPCTLIRSNSSSNNLFENNEFVGDDASYCFYMAYASNCIVSNNTMSGFHVFGMAFYHSDSTIISGNKISNPIIVEDNMLHGGLLIFGESCNNHVAGNEIFDTPKGISVHQHSDFNQIENNHIQGSSTGIIISTSDNNIIYKNNFVENIIPGFDTGDNIWSVNGMGNYWSDYKQSDIYFSNDEGYRIPPNGMDEYPSESTFSIEPVVTPVLATTSFRESVENEFYISEDIHWTNQSKEITYLRILDGGSVTIENSTIIFSNQSSSFNGIDMNSGATLKINNSNIYLNGALCNAEKGANVEITESRLFNLGFYESNDMVLTDNVIFKDNIVADGWDIIFGSNCQIVNNHFINVVEGIAINGDNSVISNNTVENTIIRGIDLNGNYNDIHDNTIINCWGNALYIDVAESNNIYRNNFIGYDSSVRIGFGLNNFFINYDGNYYSDYLDRIPSGKESTIYNDRWNLPYRFAWGDNIDEHPSRICFYTDTLINVPDHPVLIYPDSNASINMINPIFKWLNDTTAETFRIQISEDSTFSVPLINKGSIYDTTYCCILDSNKIYYWRVISVNDDGHSHWSETWHFDTNSETGIQACDDIKIPKKFTLYQNYPNPFNPLTTITFDLPRQSKVTIKVIDLLGNEIDTILSRTYSSGRHKLEWNGQNYSSGIYLYKLTADNYVGIKKFILLK